MEYEQVERGRRVVTDAITSQDVNGYYDLLSPQVLLVTHFPYPPIIADSNLQGVRRWVHKSEKRHLTVVAAAAAAAAAAAGGGGGGAATIPAAGSRGYATASLNTPSKASTASPVTVAGESGVRSQRQRVRELLRRQEQWRIAGQRRYEAFRKRRERTHRCATGDEVDDDDVGGADGSVRGGNADALVEQAALPQQAKTDGHGRARSAGRTIPVRHNASKSPDNRVRSEASAAAARAADGLRWFQQQQRQTQPSQPIARSHQQWSAVGSSAPTSTDASAAAHKNRLSDGNLVPYEDAVTITEGQLLVSHRLFELLHWVASSASKSGPTGQMVPVEVDLQLRKDILQEEEVLVPPPVPTTEQEAYSQLGRQFTERNQPLSCMRVVWGAENLLFEDKIFFDDGLAVTIHRRMLTVAEVLAKWTPAVPPSSLALCDMSSSPLPLRQRQTRLSERKGRRASLPPGKAGGSAVNARGLAVGRPEQVYHAVEAFYKPIASRVDTRNDVWPLLDFSFVEATEPAALLRATPVSGRVHVNQVPRAVLDPQAIQGVFLNKESDPSKADKSVSKRTLIKARNKHGEEEAYEFQTQKRRFSFNSNDDGVAGGGDGDEFGTSGTTGSRQRNKNGTTNGFRPERYDASCVRISGCHLHAKMEQLLPVLRRLVANCFLTLHTLDMSQNGISSLTDLSLLPLENLRLHGNAIADWRVVETRIAPLPYLSILTLHGNPIAEETGLGDTVGCSGKAVAQDSNGADIHSNASRDGRAAGDSNYWRRLLALLLGNPARVVPLRQVDFVTLTGLEYNIAGAYEMFTTGRSGVLAKARSAVGMGSGCTQKVR
ncbi:hypothetical protein JKF63_06393 [Porcisia hertigi]|uniref:Leucine-rich repeat-containing protein 51 n=1 Tax=Porcisia hertigi TaxID=2761500 RepID=A0A836LJV6_9TRYP|nr:hypothetical protein JKF63_06393 [Porcisia hertigi]